MARNPSCTVYIGNLDEKISERVLYDILIQVGRVIDLYIPRDKETNRHKGYAFAEYETEEIAEYAVKLFSGLVRLNNKTLKFAISGQDKPSQNTISPITPKPFSPLPKPLPMHSVHAPDTDASRANPVTTAQELINYRVSGGTHSISPAYPQASAEGLISRGLCNGNYEYSRRVLGAMLNNVSHPGARHPVTYPSY
ncbi:splicing factor 3B subunit 4 isoform X1 [Phoenix dactylifera]|uniref:Splicing factor 3B subunit 4 isoform X1 n=1 Tax=Phoenix dactylifera TaxID=42345 RepID=A0A8B7CUS7_PHODC|nr:splicing factor 3B subunit 4 isoform X1 [Phoenix dactylifera]